MVRLLCLLSLVGVSCGLISPDVTNFPLKFPRSDFTIDTADWNVQGSGTVPSVPCPPADCSAAASQLCGSGAGCTADCDTSASTPTCEAHVTQSLVKTYNLAVQAPEYDQIASQPVAKVSIDDIAFIIDTNTLNVDTPAFQVYMAPMTVMDPTDPSAKLIGVIDPIPAGMTGTGTLAFAQGGKANMEAFMDDFHTPFNVIVSGTIDVKGGEPIPQGKLVGYVSGDAHAGL